MVTHPPPPPAASSGGPGWPAHYPAPIPVAARGQAIALWIAVSASAIVSIAALVMGIIAVTNTAQASPAPGTPVPAETPTPATPILFDDDADRALCEALPDLMREVTSRRNAFIVTPVDSPERKAAIPRFKTESEDWASRMQQVLAAHAEPDRYMTRTLQRYIDDVLLYSQNTYPERQYDKFDDLTWNLAVVDYGGALGRCQQLGIRWS